MQKKNNIRVIKIISLLQGMVFYASIATLYRQQAGLTLFQISLIESISLAVSMALEVPWGILADRIGHRKTMVCCSLIFFLSKIVFWKAQGFGGFLAERLLLAVTLAGLSGVDESILYDSCGEGEFQKVYGQTQALGTAGLVFASLVCSLALRTDYRLAALLTVIAYGLAALCALFLKETRQSGKERSSPFAGFRAALGQVFHSRSLLLLIFCGALYGEVVHTITVFLNQPQYIRCGLDSRFISAAYILAVLAEMSSFLSDRITRFFGEKRTGVLLLLLSAVSCAVLALTSNGWLSLFCILALCLASTLFNPLSGAVENRLITVDDRATALSVSSLMTDSIAMLVSLLLGRTADGSLPLAMALGAGFCLMALLMYVFVQPAAKQSR